MKPYLQKRIKKQTGLTLIEVLIAIFIGSFAILGIYRLFSSSLRSYNLQEQISGMYQNGTYTIKKFSEMFMQAGADLPPKNDTLLFAPVSTHPDSFRIMINPNGAAYTFTSNQKATDTIPVPNAAAFCGCDSILKDSLDTVFTSFKIAKVDTLYSDTIFIIGAPVAFSAGTTIYGFKTVGFSLKAGTVYYTDSTSKVLAENIDTLKITYYDKNHASTTDWLKMVSASIYVRARTAQADPRYKCPGFNDGYRRLPLSTEVHFRNRF